MSKSNTNSTQLKLKQLNATRVKVRPSSHFTLPTTPLHPPQQTFQPLLETAPIHVLHQPIQYLAKTQLVVCVVIIIVDVEVVPSSVPVGKFSTS